MFEIGLNNRNYIQFLQYCLNKRKGLPDSTREIDWKKMMTWAESQAIVGIIYSGINDVRNQREDGKSKLQIPFDTLMKWIGYGQQIEAQNRLLNKRCVEITDKMKAFGLGCCVLKGQANAQMYTHPLSRTSGDIDLLVFGDRQEVTRMVREKNSNVHENYIHIDYPVFKDVAVELHFWPSYANNPIYNKRIQKWYRKMLDGGRLMVETELPEGVGRIPVASIEFNIIYQLMHMMHHFFDEGIGLRQMIDYYFLLKARNNDVRCKREDVRDTLKYLNLYNFAGAVMYIMKEVLGLDEKYLIVPVDERRGKTLLNEILKGGNFGHYSGLAQNNAAKKYFQKTWRNMQLVKEYPAEALFEPVFRTWHFFWRQWQKYA